jgi:hypothetical protein
MVLNISMSQNTTLAKSKKSVNPKGKTESLNTIPAGLVNHRTGKVRKSQYSVERLKGLNPAKKGEVRNPKGINGSTSAKADMVTRAQTLVDKAMKVLEKNLNSTDERVAQTAAQMILDRSFGKPVQPTAETDSDGNDRPAPPPMTVVPVQVITR